MSVGFAEGPDGRLVPFPQMTPWEGHYHNAIISERIRNLPISKADLPSLLIARGAISGRVRAEAVRQLETARVPATGLRSKTWDEFAKPDAPVLDFVFTVCDRAAKEVCPVWPGQPMTAHWGVPDPAAVSGTAKEVERAFRDAFFILERRISLFLSLPLASIEWPRP